MKFLIIDDSQEMVDIVSLCVNMCWPQAELLSTHEGKRGLELVAEHAPDLVILDISLPDINGLEVLRSLRGISDVPVMMLTVRGQDVEIARFLKEGADDYVVKPFNFVDLMERMQVLITGSVLVRPMNQQSLRALEAASHTVNAADPNEGFPRVITRCITPECSSGSTGSPRHQYHAHYIRQSNGNGKQEVVEVLF